MSNGWTEEELRGVEEAHPDGMTVQQIVGVFARHSERLTEATFRKYVQLGLLPRSVRVRRRGSRRGSQGLYPASAVRQIDEIRRLMKQGFTIEEIQKELLFVRGDVEELSGKLDKIYRNAEEALGRRDQKDDVAEQLLVDAKQHAARLIDCLLEIERRMSTRARLARAVV